MRACFLALALSLCAPNPARAEQPDREKLRDLADQFADKVGRGFEEANLMMTGKDKLKLMELRSGSTVEDGEPLILRATAGRENIALKGDILAVPHSRRLLVSLANFCDDAGLAISVDPAKGQASGWYYREDQPFFLSVPKKTVTLAGKEEPLDPRDVLVQGQDVLVSSALLEKWFGIGISVDLSALSMHVDGGPLPAEEAARRAKQPKYAAGDTNTPQLPLQKEPYSLFTKPYMDVNVSAFERRLGNGLGTTYGSNWSVIGSGDLLNMTSRTVAIGNVQNNGSGHALSSLRETLGRTDPDGEWGGGVRWFEFGDVITPTLPVIGGGVQEQGVFLSSRLPNEQTTLSHLDVRGDATPGWDVELYNNDILIGDQQVALDGTYNFPAVFLYEGENDMRIVFYGPQGEVREEKRHVVSSASLGGSQSAWDVSLTRQNMVTYNADQGHQSGDGDPRLVARYEHSLGDLGSAHAGILHQSESSAGANDQADALQAGVASTVAGALVNADAAYESQGRYSADLLARKTHGEREDSLHLTHSSRNFTFAPQNLVDAETRGVLKADFAGLSNINYFGEASYEEIQGSSTTQANGGLSARYGNLALNTSLRYTFSGASGVLDDKLTGSSSVRGFFGKGRWHFGATYGVEHADLSTLDADYDYPFTPELEGIAAVRHEQQSGLSELDMRARWQPAAVAVTPHLTVDTNHRVDVGVNMSFGMAQNPLTGEYKMVNRSISANGGAAARVFLDANGNGVMDAGEEPLPGVQIEALQTGARKKTDDKGVAFLPDLLRSVHTDIAATANTLPDPFYVTADPGVSLRPRPGVTSEVDFPVVVAGEMDGIAGLSGGGFARGANLSLVAPDGRVEQTVDAADDGYYSFSVVHPGVYYLVVQPRGGEGFVLPKQYAFKATGSNFYGENIVLSPGNAVGFTFSAANKPAWRRGRVQLPEDIAQQRAVLRVGSYKSGLALALAWYRLKYLSPLQEGFALARPLGDIEPDAVGKMHIPLVPAQPLGMAAAADVCRLLGDSGYDCAVEVVTTLRDPSDDKLSSAKKPSAG